MPTPHPTADGTWPRWRLLATLAGIAVTGLLLLVGLGVALRDALTQPAPRPMAPASASALPSLPAGPAHRDQVAAAPMLRVTAADAHTPDVATSPADTLTIPTSDQRGPAGVATGFPHTPEGAVAQLAAIEVRVIEAMSIPVARAVHGAWVAEGGPGFADWELTHSVRAFLNAAQLPGTERDESILIAATPAAGLVKGTDGPDWVLACVLLDVRASIASDARIGYGHCARMEWRDGRWLIGPGIPPARAPSVWPGSELAVTAGWRTWTPSPGRP